MAGKRKTQYKRNPRLADGQRRYRAYQERRGLWQQVLSTPMSDTAVEKIADLLARLEFKPDEEGGPCGDWPPIPKMDVRVFLDSLGRQVRDNPETGEREELDTLAWKAEILEAALLVRAGVIELKQEQIRELFNLTDDAMVIALLLFSDLEAFCHRPGFHLSNAEILEKSSMGETIIDRDSLAKMLSRARGDT